MAFNFERGAIRSDSYFSVTYERASAVEQGKQSANRSSIRLFEGSKTLFLSFLSAHILYSAIAPLNDFPHQYVCHDRLRRHPKSGPISNAHRTFPRHPS